MFVSMFEFFKLVSLKKFYLHKIKLVKRSQRSRRKEVKYIKVKR